MAVTDNTTLKFNNYSVEEREHKLWIKYHAFFLLFSSFISIFQGMFFLFLFLSLVWVLLHLHFLLQLVGIIRLALDKQHAPFNTTGQECCLAQWAQLYGRKSINPARSLLSGMSLMGKSFSFQGAFTGAILQETILTNCTECVCLKKSRSDCVVLHSTAKYLPWC